MIAQDVWIGIDLGGTFIKAGLVTESGEVLAEDQIPTEDEAGPGHVLDRIALLVKRLSELPDKKDRVKGVGVGIPGQVTFETGVVRDPPNLEGWGRVEAKAELEKRLGLSVFVDNDANVAALGEHAFGAGRNTTEMLMVTLGTGVGGGLVLRGEVYRGAVGGAGEFGHMVIQMNGPVCNCGRRGCVEAFVGTAGILRNVREKLESGRDSILKSIDPDSMMPKHVGEAAAEGDAVAIDVLRETGEYLGIGLGSAANLLNLERAVIGGGVAKAGEFILGPARESMKRIAHTVSRESIDLVPAILGNEAGIAGAGRLAMGTRNFRS